MPKLNEIVASIKSAFADPTDESKTALIIYGLMSIAGVAFLAWSDANRDSKIDKTRLIFNSIALSIILVVIPLLARWRALRNKLKQKNISLILKMWSVGFVLYLVTFIYVQVGYDKNDTLEKFIIRTAVLISLAIIILSTTVIFVMLRPSHKDPELTKEQRLVGSFATISLLGAVAGIFIARLNVAAIVFGFIAIKRTYHEENANLKNLSVYRTMSFLTMTIVIVRFVSSFVIVMVVGR